MTLDDVKRYQDEEPDPELDESDDGSSDAEPDMLVATLSGIWSSSTLSLNRTLGRRSAVVPSKVRSLSPYVSHPTAARL